MGISGGNAIAAGYGSILDVTNSATTTVGTQRGFYVTNYVSGSGDVTNCTGYTAQITVDSTGNVTTGSGFSVAASTLSSTGAVANSFGFAVANIGHASLVTNAVAFNTADQTGSLTLTAGFRGQLTSGTGKYNLYMDGTAQNYMLGVTGIGIAPSSTAALALAASTTGVASLRIPSGTAPSSPVAGDLWYDGTNLKFRDGGTTRTITWT